jgi:hypothetical protein
MLDLYVSFGSLGDACERSKSKGLGGTVLCCCFSERTGDGHVKVASWESVAVAAAVNGQVDEMLEKGVGRGLAM